MIISELGFYIYTESVKIFDKGVQKLDNQNQGIDNIMLNSMEKALHLINY